MKDSDHGLLVWQRKFENNPQNNEFAYKYFRELNRAQKF